MQNISKHYKIEQTRTILQKLAIVLAIYLVVALLGAFYFVSIQSAQYKFRNYSIDVKAMPYPHDKTFEDDEERIIYVDDFE